MNALVQWKLTQLEQNTCSTKFKHRSHNCPKTRCASPAGMWPMTCGRWDVQPIVELIRDKFLWQHRGCHHERASVANKLWEPARHLLRDHEEIMYIQQGRYNLSTVLSASNQNLADRDWCGMHQRRILLCLFRRCRLNLPGDTDMWIETHVTTCQGEN